MKIRPLELFLIEVVLYFILWLTNDYLATLLSLVFGGIFLLLWLFSLTAELIERSKVPRWYFQGMFVSFLAPLIVAIIYLSITGGLEWLAQ